MKQFIREFKEFALRGNVVDIAIGIIIGAAFSRITDSLVNDVLMPPIGYFLAGVDFSSIEIVLSKEPLVDIKIGAFLNTLFNFIIVAFSMFLVVKTMNFLRREKAQSKNP